MLLSALGASLFGNMLTGKGTLRAGYGNKEEKVLRTGYGSEGLQSKILVYLKKLITPHGLINFEILKYFRMKLD